MSWKTTACGILGILSAGITMIAKPLLDGDPSTSAQWGAFLPILMAGLMGLFARDHNVTSEDAGLK